MTLIRTVSPNEAEGRVKQVYDFMIKKAGVIPKPLEMMSVSPNLLELAQQSLDYFLRHPTLGASLLGHIRMLVALHLNYNYCVRFNAEVLKKYAGTSDDQLSAVKTDPLQANLSEKDRAMLLFVLKAIQTSEATNQPDIDRLHDLGWTDTDILDATFHGADMVRHAIMFKAFQMDRE